ncbi:MAG: ORF6N domain-containing protein, partial [Shimia sp.]|nr:ORF6N domain-containing protein [Shimia sp.]
ETATEDVRTQQQRLRLHIAQRLAQGDYTNDADRKGLLDLLNAMKD